MAVKLPRQWTPGSSRRKGEIPLDISKLEPGAFAPGFPLFNERALLPMHSCRAAAPLGRLANGLEMVRERLHHPAVGRFLASSSLQIRRDRYLSTSPNEHCLCQILVCFFVSPLAFLSLPVTTTGSGEQLASAWQSRKAGVRCRAAPPARLQVQASLPCLQRRTLLRLSTLQSA